MFLELLVPLLLQVMSEVCVLKVTLILLLEWTTNLCLSSILHLPCLPLLLSLYLHCGLWNHTVLVGLRVVSCSALDASLVSSQYDTGVRRGHIGGCLYEVVVQGPYLMLLSMGFHTLCHLEGWTFIINLIGLPATSCKKNYVFTRIGTKSPWWINCWSSGLHFGAWNLVGSQNKDWMNLNADNCLCPRQHVGRKGCLSAPSESQVSFPIQEQIPPLF